MEPHCLWAVLWQLQESRFVVFEFVEALEVRLVDTAGRSTWQSGYGSGLPHAKNVGRVYFRHTPPPTSFENVVRELKSFAA